MLLSATVGNAMEFFHWLRHSHNRKLELVAGDERRVPLRYHWIGDMLLTEQLEDMAQGDDERERRRPWSSASIATNVGPSAEQIKGKRF